MLARPSTSNRPDFLTAETPRLRARIDLSLGLHASAVNSKLDLFVIISGQSDG